MLGGSCSLCVCPFFFSRLFLSVQSIDDKLRDRYDGLLVDPRNSIFVLVSFLLLVTVVPSGIWLVTFFFFSVFLQFFLLLVDTDLSAF
jgi:hypothetical protein